MCKLTCRTYTYRIHTHILSLYPDIQELKCFQFFVLEWISGSQGSSSKENFCSLFHYLMPQTFRSWIVALLSLFSHILSDFIFQSSNYKTQSNIHWVLTLMLGAWTPEIMKSPCLLHQETTGEDWIVVLWASLTRLQEEMVDIYDIWIPFWIFLHVRVLKVVGKRWKAHPLNLY